MRQNWGFRIVSWLVTMVSLADASLVKVNLKFAPADAMALSPAAPSNGLIDRVVSLFLSRVRNIPVCSSVLSESLVDPCHAPGIDLRHNQTGLPSRRGWWYWMTDVHLASATVI